MPARAARSGNTTLPSATGTRHAKVDVKTDVIARTPLNNTHPPREYSGRYFMLGLNNPWCQQINIPAEPKKPILKRIKSRNQSECSLANHIQRRLLHAVRSICPAGAEMWPSGESAIVIQSVLRKAFDQGARIPDLGCAQGYGSDRSVGGHTDHQLQHLDSRSDAGIDAEIEELEVNADWQVATLHRIPVLRAVNLLRLDLGHGPYIVGSNIMTAPLLQIGDRYSEVGRSFGILWIVGIAALLSENNIHALAEIG